MDRAGKGSRHPESIHREPAWRPRDLLNPGDIALAAFIVILIALFLLRRGGSHKTGDDAASAGAHGLAAPPPALSAGAVTDEGSAPAAPLTSPRSSLFLKGISNAPPPTGASAPPVRVKVEPRREIQWKESRKRTSAEGKKPPVGAGASGEAAPLQM